LGAGSSAQHRNAEECDCGSEAGRFQRFNTFQPFKSLKALRAKEIVPILTFSPRRTWKTSKPRANSLAKSPLT
jgi:hypothetical protein